MGIIDDEHQFEEHVRVVSESIIDEKLRAFDEKIGKKIKKGENVSRAIDCIAVLIAAAVAIFTYIQADNSTRAVDQANTAINLVKTQTDNSTTSVAQTNQALDLAKTQADNSTTQITQTNQAIELAKESVVYTNKNFTLQQRAYVAFDGWGGGPEDFIVKLKNAGSTPAMRVIHNRRIMFLQKDEIPGFVKTVDDPNFDPGNDEMSTIGPGGSPPVQAVTIVNKDYLDYDHKNDVKKFFNGLNTMVVTGIIRYNDIFGASHYTRYCGLFSKETIHVTYCNSNNDMN